MTMAKILLMLTRWTPGSAVIRARKLSDTQTDTAMVTSGTRAGGGQAPLQHRAGAVHGVARLQRQERTVQRHLNQRAMTVVTNETAADDAVPERDDLADFQRRRLGPQLLQIGHQFTGQGEVG